MPIAASPFPGLDPYLEAHWRDVHHRFMTYAADDRQAQLPAGLRARVVERVFVESGESLARSINPDIRVIKRGRNGDAPRGATGTAIAEPLLIQLADEPASQGYIEILDVGSGNRVISVIELLSVSNKIDGEGQDPYLRKQRELSQGRVSLVEIDLLREGKRVLMIPPERIPPSHRTTYQVCVHRGWRPDVVEVYAARLREPLPTIGIPLREGEADAALGLQALIGRCYSNGRYDDIDYSVEPNPPLPPPDAAWADELLRSEGVR